MKADAYHHGDLRQAVLAEAHSRVERDGASNLSIAAIAKALGVSQAAPYRHFGDRNGLLAVVATNGFERFSRQLVDATTNCGRTGELSALANAYIAFALAHPGLYRLMFASDILLRVQEGDTLKRASHDSFRLLVTLLEDENEHERQGKALDIWVSLHGAAMLAMYGLLEDNPSGVQLNELIEGIVCKGNLHRHR